ncbi:hypothetical protein [Novipirellula sp.]|uniref:hypothetical protein n=1 Tax=Novipirellula sp. TaxID=2795430 RepID=UPI0035662095
MNRRALHQINTAILVSAIGRRRSLDKNASVGGRLELNANHTGGLSSFLLLWLVVCIGRFQRILLLFEFQVSHFKNRKLIFDF